MRRFATLAIFCTLVVSLACEPGSPPPPWAVKGAIIGGTPDTGHPAVGAILIGGGAGLCSGTLVSPRVVVTAAHCTNGEGGNPTSFVLGSSADSGTPYAVKAFEYNPAYNPDVDGSGKTAHDIGVVVLSKAASVTPMPYRTTSIDGLKGAAITFSGFGIRSVYDPSQVGDKYMVGSTIGSIETEGFWNYTSSSNPKNTCSGDSGGPGFYVDGGVEQVISVTSSGDEYCRQDGWNTRIDVNATWLAQMIAKYDTVANPVCGNGVCETGETTANCAKDCPASKCGNGTCDPGETTATCPGDCPPTTTGLWDACDASGNCSGSMVCVQESSGPTHCTLECGSGLAACPAGYECYAMSSGGAVCVPSSTTTPTCGDGTCDSGETTANCPADCSGTTGIWGACGTNYACPGQQICVQEEDGSLHCTTECDGSTVGCPSGYECVGLQGGGGACAPTGGTTACGNGTCEAGETTANCAKDCPAPGPVCGNGACEAGETTANCSADCPPTGPDCGNGACEAGETNATCAADCPAPGPVCGNGACEGGETNATCAADCPVEGPVCGNGACEGGETNATCPADCPVEGPVCGNGTCEGGESRESCPVDCVNGDGPVCGNDLCEVGETPVGCPRDCRVGGPVCGDGACDDGEACDSCPQDCGTCDGTDATEPPDGTSPVVPRKSGGGCSGSEVPGSASGAGLLLMLGLVALGSRRRARA